MKTLILVASLFAAGASAADINAMYVQAKERSFRAVLMPDHGSYSIDNSSYIECPQGVQVEQNGTLMMVYQCQDNRTIVISAPTDPKVPATVTIMDHLQKGLYRAPVSNVTEVQ